MLIEIWVRAIIIWKWWPPCLFHALLKLTTITSIRAFEEGVVSVDVDKTIDMKDKKETGRLLLVRMRVGPPGT